MSTTLKDQHAEQVARALRRSVTMLLGEFRRTGASIDSLIESGHAEQVADVDYWSNTLTLASSEIAGCLELARTFAALNDGEDTTK